MQYSLWHILLGTILVMATPGICQTPAPAFQRLETDKGPEFQGFLPPTGTNAPSGAKPAKAVATNVLDEIFTGKPSTYRPLKIEWEVTATTVVPALKYLPGNEKEGALVNDSERIHPTREPALDVGLMEKQSKTMLDDNTTDEKAATQKTLWINAKPGSGQAPGDPVKALGSWLLAPSSSAGEMANSPDPRSSFGRDMRENPQGDPPPKLVNDGNSPSLGVLSSQPLNLPLLLPQATPMFEGGARPPPARPEIYQITPKRDASALLPPAAKGPATESGRSSPLNPFSQTTPPDKNPFAKPGFPGSPSFNNQFVPASPFPTVILPAPAPRTDDVLDKWEKYFEERKRMGH